MPKNILSNPYTIYYVDQQLLDLVQFLKKNNYSKLIILTDEHTNRDCLPIIERALIDFSFHVIQIPAGEDHKTIDSCQIIWTALMELQADRNALLLNLGGGVIGDMGGFCAATYKRGIDFVQVPTTLLAQVDASVGGKLGIDFNTIKNGIGLFQNPKAVFICTGFFKTLPKEELRSGYAEVLKHYLIADKKAWEENYKIHFDSGIAWEAIVAHSVGIKKEIVTIDPLEQGLRKVLNFGHTIGHAIESLSWESSKPFLHGEAVAIGLLIECYWSHRLDYLSEVELKTVEECIKKNYSDLTLPSLEIDRIYELMLQDKKNRDGQVCCTLLNGIGNPIININISSELVKEGIIYFNSL